MLNYKTSKTDLIQLCLKSDGFFSYNNSPVFRNVLYLHTLFHMLFPANRTEQPWNLIYIRTFSFNIIYILIKIKYGFLCLGFHISCGCNWKAWVVCAVQGRKILTYGHLPFSFFFLCYWVCNLYESVFKYFIGIYLEIDIVCDFFFAWFWIILLIMCYKKCQSIKGLYLTLERSMFFFI